MNILIVDGSRLLCWFLVAFFQRKGHTAVSLRDPAEVEGWLQANPCDAIILETALPKTNGLELLSKLRETYSPKELPIIIFSRRGYDTDLMADARDRGSNGFVSKYLGPSEMYSALMQVFEK